jgi:regulatory protein
VKETQKPLTPLQAIEKARKFCTYQERCHSELRNRLYEWKLRTSEVEQIMARMIEEGFLNEERFAQAFAGGKFRQQHWGRVKIRLELKARQVSDYCIKMGLKEIDEDDYLKVMEKEAQKKLQSLKDRNPLVKNNKVARYLAGKGFEQDLVWDYLNKRND